MYHFTNTTFSLSGQGSRNQDKKPYKFDLSGDETDKANSEIFDRKEFKLRSLRFDPSYIKNKLAGDIAESLGLPIVQTTICRLYINNKSYGLYEISDLYKKKFVKRFFNPTTNTDGVVYGSLYKVYKLLAMILFIHKMLLWYINNNIYNKINKIFLYLLLLSLLLKAVSGYVSIINYNNILVLDKI